MLNKIFFLSISCVCIMVSSQVSAQVQQGQTRVIYVFSTGSPDMPKRNSTIMDDLDLNNALDPITSMRRSIKNKMQRKNVELEMSVDQVNSIEHTTVSRSLGYDENLTLQRQELQEKPVKHNSQGMGFDSMHRIMRKSSQENTELDIPVNQVSRLEYTTVLGNIEHDKNLTLQRQEHQKEIVKYDNPDSDINTLSNANPSNFSFEKTKPIFEDNSTISEINYYLEFGNDNMKLSK